ncbi:hypothetical protein SE17_26205, partial [Kouleothrix aurantiaca]
QSGGARSFWVGARQSLAAFAPGYLLLAGGWLAWARPGAALGLVLLAHGVALLGVALLCWSVLAARRYRLAPWWGALFPLGTAIYFGLAGWGLLRLRLGRGVTWKGRTFR